MNAGKIISNYAKHKLSKTFLYTKNTSVSFHPGLGLAEGEVACKVAWTVHRV